jgi:hypothetical protein
MMFDIELVDLDQHIVVKHVSEENTVAEVLKGKNFDEVFIPGKVSTECARISA